MHGLWDLKPIFEINSWINLIEILGFIRAMFDSENGKSRKKIEITFSFCW